MKPEFKMFEPRRAFRRGYSATRSVIQRKSIQWKTFSRGYLLSQWVFCQFIGIPGLIDQSVVIQLRPKWDTDSEFLQNIRQEPPNVNDSC